MDENQNEMAEGPESRNPSMSDDITTHTREITPGLFLGPYAAAMKSKLKVLQLNGITHIVCIRQALEANFVRPNFPQHFRYLVQDICDSPTESIIHYFRQANEFINGAFASGGKVLVHGNGGISRSAAIVIAYVMERYCLSFNESIGIVRHKRFCLSVNEGFLRQLMEYEHIYRAEADSRSLIKDIPFPLNPSGSSKRKRDTEDEEQSQYGESY